MKKFEELQRALAWFHMLEVHQVSLYKAQSALADNEVDRRMFLKVAEIESRHIDNTLEALISIGGSQSMLSSVAPIMGTGLGTLTGITVPMALKSDIILENQAMNAYQAQISKCDNDRILEVLWSNYLEESLHTEWFKARLEHDTDKVGQ